MAECKNCYNNCGDTKTSDKCVKTTLPDDEDFGICTGDPLYDVELILIEKIKSALDSTGIVINSVSLENCTYLKSLFVGKDKTISNYFQLLIDAFCALKEEVKNLAPKPKTFETGCLTGLTSASTPDDILQALLISYCSLKQTVAEFPSTYVKGSDLSNLVKTIITEYNNEIPPVPVVAPTYREKLVPYVAYEYYGPLSNFDSAGKGLASVGFDKVYLCNGANGTPDKRGRVAVGAVRNIPGGSIDAAVDPTVHPNINYAVGDKAGQNYVSLAASQLPSFTFPIAATSTTIIIPGQKGGDNSDHTNTTAFAFGDKSPNESSFAGSISKTITLPGQNVTIQNAGLSHENRQPLIAAAFIMYVP